MSIKPQNHVNWHKRALITWWRRASMSDSMSYDPKYTLLSGPHMISSKPEPSFQQDVNNFLSVYLETLPYHQVIKSLLTSIWLLMFLQIIQHFILSYTWWWHVLLIKKNSFPKGIKWKEFRQRYLLCQHCCMHSLRLRNFYTKTQISKGELRHSKLR